MTRSGNKNYRGLSRRSHSHNVSDDALVEEKKDLKNKEKTRNDADRHIFESSMGVEDPKIRFDYSDNVFSYRGDWESRIKVIKIFFPFIVNRKKCKKFEELINDAFETIFLV